jgi:AcrR family transcriptional regulator
MTQEPTLTKGERTRQAILEVAERLIISQGYHATSMRQIADEAGIAVGGIYNHFSGKEAIFAALLEIHQPYTNIVAALPNLPGESVAELVEGAAHLLIDAILADPVFVRLAMIDMQEFEGHTILQFANQMIHGLLAFAARLVATDQLRQDLPLPVMLRAFAGQVVFYVISEIVAFSGDSPLIDFPLPDDIDWIGGIVDVYLNGVLRKT